MAGSTAGAHAVVIGASMAGLTVAKALAGAYERVTVFDRDAVPETVGHRAGVPQGRHAHALLAAGGDALEELFPHVIDDIVRAGATFADPGDHGRWCVNGHRLARGPLGRETLLATRPLIEAHVRRRVRADPAVRIVQRCAVRGLLTTGGRVAGVLVRPRADGRTQEAVTADLVVDCSGRRSLTPQWLEALGYACPAVEELRVEVRYSTRNYRLPVGTLGDDVVVFIGPTRHAPRGGLMIRVEGDRWLVTLAAMGGERPPSDPDRYTQFAARLPMSDLHDALQLGEPLDDPVEYRYPASVRHRYERLTALPDGLLVAGDAVCSFNPIYGQGMTVAALEALTMRRLLAEATQPAPRAWFSAIAAIADVPWDLAIVADLGIACIEGRRSARTRLLNAYLGRFHAAGAHDPALGALFAQVAGLVASPGRLLHPATIARVVRGNLRRPPAPPAPVGAR